MRTPVPANWDVLVIQPDLALPDDGFLDALALVDNPPLGQPFLLSFVWLKSGSPGTQTFELYDTTSGFQILPGGVSTAVIPEPGAFGFSAAIGIAGWCLWRRPQRTKPTKVDDLS